MSTRTDNMKAFGASAAVTALGVGGTLAALSTRSFVPAAIVTLAFLTVDFLTVSAVKTCYGSTKSALIDRGKRRRDSYGPVKNRAPLQWL